MQAGREARWQALYSACRPVLYRSAALLVGEAEAEEVVQESFERAMREPDFFARIKDPQAWLRTVVTRLALGRLRRRETLERVQGLLRFRGGDPDSRRADLEAALRKLPGRQRAAVVMRYYQDANYSEIAAALEMDEASVGPLLTRARAALKASLK